MRGFLALQLLLLVLLGVGCDGSDDQEIDTGLAIPRRGDAAYGAFGHVLGSDRGRSNDDRFDRLWIGFGRRESWDRYLRLRDQFAPDGAQPWICGHVVVDDGEPLGFYFNPATTDAAEITAETFQISLDGLKRDSNRPATAGYACVTFFAEEVVPGSGE